MPEISRRKFLETSAITGAAVVFGGFSTRFDRFKALGNNAFAGDSSLYGTISPTASSNTGELFLELPSGFQYNVIGRSGSPMTNGQPTPVSHDGMAVFRDSSLPNSWVLVRNHEFQGFAGTSGAVSGTTPYDALAGGGTTTLIVDKQTRLVSDSFTSLSGTLWNCSGGPTPWRTWISCEETTAGPLNGFSQPHGYCFEVAPRSPATPVPLTHMGRFRHEAVAVDKTSGIVYLTEDANPACGFYRFVPNRRGQLLFGGRLQMLKIALQPGFDTRTNQTVGTKLLATWVDIAEPDPPSVETNPLAVFNQGLAQGGATFSRLEGCYAVLNEIYFTSTNGGNAGRGQIWKYESRPKSQFGWLTLVYESPSAAVLDFPDNLCFGPNGSLFLCEDGAADNFIRILTRTGTLSNFARNIVPGLEATEFTGSVFSRDFQTLFVNIQAAGITLAIWGNW